VVFSDSEKVEVRRTRYAPARHPVSSTERVSHVCCNVTLPKLASKTFTTCDFRACGYRRLFLPSLNYRNGNNDCPFCVNTTRIILAGETCHEVHHGRCPDDYTSRYVRSEKALLQLRRPAQIPRSNNRSYRHLQSSKTHMSVSSSAEPETSHGIRSTSTGSAQMGKPVVRISNKIAILHAAAH
jgi:hypothetical protein